MCMPPELAFIGAELAFCLGDAKTEPTSSSVKISAIASFFIRLVSPLAGLFVSLTSSSGQAPPVNRARQRPISSLARRRSQRSCQRRATHPFEFSRLFWRARAAPRRLHCGICAPRLKTATRSIADMGFRIAECGLEDATEDADLNTDCRERFSHT